MSANSNKAALNIKDVIYKMRDGDWASTDVLQQYGLWTWGYNGEGQLGDGTSVNKSSPIRVGSLTNWKNLPESSSTSSHTMAIR